MSTGLFELRVKTDEDAPAWERMLFNPDMVTTIAPALDGSGYTAILTQNGGATIKEPYEIVARLWALARLDSRGSPGFYSAVPPGPVEMPHPSNKNVTVTKDNPDWIIGRTALKAQGE